MSTELVDGANQSEYLELTEAEDAAADAAFEAAFNSARGSNAGDEGSTSQNGADAGDDLHGDGSDTTGTDVGDADAEAQAAADAQARADAEAAAKAKAEAEAPVTLTKADLEQLRSSSALVTQLQAELKRTNDSVAGRFGSLKQTIEAVQAQAANGSKIAIGQLKNLEGEFPELAALLKKDFDASGTGTGAPAPAPAGKQGDTDIPLEDEASGAQAPGAHVPADPFSDPRVQARLKEKEMSIVDAVHPDWRDLKTTPEFQQWRAQLPATAQALLASTWQSNVLVDAFRDFKQYQQKRSAAATANQQRDKRLQNGIPATTGTPTGAHVIDDDAAFLEGFSKVHKGRA